MPLFQVLCEACDEVHEIFCRWEVRGQRRCPTCDGHFTPIISGVKLIGATPSKPIDMQKQLGKTFESNSEYRKYLADNPGVREVDKSSLRPKIDAIKQRKEVQAQRDGYKSWRHRTQELRKKIASDGT